MYLRVETINRKLLIGKRTTLSLTGNKTGELWRSFMPHRSGIKNGTGSDLFSVEVYDPLYFTEFDPAREFEKWAAIEVTGFDTIPEGMECLVIPAGSYAVFLHRGPAGEAAKTYRYIFEEWLPASGFILDERPHFAVMGEKYKKDDAGSEEEIWIPVRH
jgi:AraC family transcriptional regulator